MNKTTLENAIIAMMTYVFHEWERFYKWRVTFYGTRHDR